MHRRYSAAWEADGGKTIVPRRVFRERQRKEQKVSAKNKILACAAEAW